MFNGAKPAFGQTPTNTGFGGFGNTATASPFAQSFGKPPATTAFGQTPTFGQQNTSLFGSNQPNSGLFGSATTSGFNTSGATQPAFGGFAQQPQNTSLFGAAQPNTNQPSLFGQSSTFGAPAKSNFGFNQPTTSLFGQSTATNTTGTGFGSFGQTSTTGSVFGAPATAFGQTANTGNTGTAVVKYQPTAGTDTVVKNGQQSNVSTRQHCITSMKEYEGKSLEELRMEDYMANRKGPQAGAPGGLFGQTQPNATGGIFGTPNTQQQTTGIFGQQPENKSLFGNTNTLGTPAFGSTQPAFGATNPTSNSLFSNKPFAAPSTSATPFGFGAANNTNNPFGAKNFGQPGSTSLFGQTAQTTAPAFGQTQTGFTGFGTTTQPQSIFGSTTTANSTSFGIPSTSNTAFGSFGTNTNTSTAGGLFSNKPAAGFGTGAGFGTSTSAASGFGGFGTNTTGGSLFNKPSIGFGGFGTLNSTPSLGTFAGASQPSLFGNNANKPGGLFGNTGTTGTSLLGNTSTFNAPNALSNFGSTNFNGPNLLGGNSTAQKPSVSIHDHILAITTSPYGDNPIFKELPKGQDETDLLKPTNPTAQKAVLDSASKQFKVLSKTPNAVRVKPIGNVTQKSLFEGLEGSDNSIEESFKLKRNRKRLILTPKVNQNDSTNSIRNNETIDSSGIDTSLENTRSPGYRSEKENSLNGNVSDVGIINREENEESRRASWLNSRAPDKVRQQPNRGHDLVEDNTVTAFELRKGNAAANSVSTNESEIENDGSSNNTTENQSSEEDKDASELEEIAIDHPAKIVLRRKGYYTIPSLEELSEYLSEDGTSCVVPSFTIGREGYGNIFFNEPIDVFGVNLDEIVHFRHKEVTVYPDDDNKPPVGQGLNREAQVTLDQVWPHDKALHAPIKDQERLAAMNFEGKLRNSCDKKDIRFIEYRPETGSWVFRVKHFSKYGLNESDEEDESSIPTDPKKLKMSVQQPPIDPKLKEKVKSDVKDKKEALNQEEIAQKSFHNQDFMYLDQQQYSSHAEIQRSSHFNSFTSKSPTTDLARGIGTNSHKIQLMKSSFFLDDDYDSRSVISDNLQGRETPDQIVPNRVTLRTFDHYASLQGSSENVADLFGKTPSVSDVSTAPPVRIEQRIIENETEMETQSCTSVTPMPPLIVKPKVARIKMGKTYIPIKNSIGYSLSGKCVSDLGLYNFRYFKVNFSSNNILHIPDTPTNKGGNLNDMGIFKDKMQFDDHSFTTLRKININSSSQYESFEKSIVRHLEIELAHALHIEVENSDCPLIQPGKADDLISEHLEEAKNLEKLGNFEEYCVSVWSLCHALWSNREELSGQEANSHFSIMFRKNLLTEWLEEILTIKDTAMRETSKFDHLNKVFTLLLSHNIPEACEVAFQHDDAMLSLLLAQLSSGPVVRQLVQHQLSLWQKVEADNFIEIDRLKLLMLVAGVPLMSSSHGVINIFDGVYWLKALAIHLWYLSSPTASITDALVGYENSFSCNEFYALAPTPVHTDKYKINSSRPIYDLRYHILQLFSKRSYPLESLLNPATHTADPFDYRLSWLLLQMLQSLGYNHCSELAESQLHVSFANQLESAGLWHWGIFILLHLKDKNRRELCIQQILYKHVNIESNEISEKEKFVVNSLGVPQKWIDWAKAVKAGTIKNYHLQAKYLLKAKQWEQAHKIIMLHIAPDAVINENFDYLRELLTKFEDPKSKRAMKVSNWINEGQILLDFLDINDKFERLKALHQGDIETRWESLKPQFVELCSRINLFPCPTSKHRLCQSEIAQRLACFLRGILLTCPILSPCLLIKIALEKLPLPQEFAQQELRILLDTLIIDRKDQQIHH